MFQEKKPKVRGFDVNGQWRYAFHCPLGLCDTDWHRWRFAYQSAVVCKWKGHYDIPVLDMWQQYKANRSSTGENVTRSDAR